MGALRAAGCSPTGTRLLGRLLPRRAAIAPFPQQAGVDFFRAQVRESRIDQCSGRQRETISDQDRIDGQIRGLIPESWIAAAAATVMAQGTV